MLSQKIGKNNIYQVCSVKRLERITFIKYTQSKDWKEKHLSSMLSQKIGKNNIYQVCSVKTLERITFIKYT